MQTFLPFSDFKKSAECLDNKRLAKQRVEAMQILKALLVGSGWRNHPAVKMWKGYEKALAIYGISICDEWIGRGYKDTCKSKILSMIKDINNPIMPFWLGNEKFHLSHQSNLKRKKPDYYKFDIPDNLEYFWPV